jgi:RNA polymerase sigma factor (sigma-70 family)
MPLDHRRFLAGDPFTASLYRQASRQWARRYFDDPARIESVVQAALLEMLERLHGGEEPDPERIIYWIFKCTHNAVRRQQTRMRRTDAVPFESKQHGQSPIDMSQTLQDRRYLDMLKRALHAQIDKARRQIFEARMYGESYREIATTQDVTEVNARKSVSQVRKVLRNEAVALDTRDAISHRRRLRRRGAP